MFASSKPRLIAAVDSCSLQNLENARRDGLSTGIVYAESFEISKSVRAALLDFNGTIACTEPAYREAMRQALCSLLELSSLPDQVWAELRTSWNMPNMLAARTVLRSLRLLFPEYCSGKIIGPEKLCQRQHEIFTSQLDNLPLSLMEGAGSLINGLNLRGISMSVVTGSHPAEVNATLLRFGLSNMFLYSDFATEVEAELRKPHSHLFARAIIRQEVPVTKALAFENTVKGALSAVGAGLTTLVASNNPRDFALQFSSQQREMSTREKLRSEKIGTLVLVPSLVNVFFS